MAKQQATDFVLFGEKKLSDLFQEIYTNQRTKKQKIGSIESGARVLDLLIRIGHKTDHRNLARRYKDGEVEV